MPTEWGRPNDTPCWQVKVMLGLRFLGLTQTLVLGEEGGSSGGLNLGLIQETHLPDADRVWPAL